MFKSRFLSNGLIFICYLALYLTSFYSGALWDDNVFIFNSPAITQSSHPFVFFNYKTDTFRAWPLGYVVFWTLYNLLGSNFVLYKLINILIHFGNFLLVRRLLTQLKLRFAFLVSLIFLIHPLHVESVSWIFQLNTMLAFTFFMLALLYLEKKPALSAVFFAISVFTKSYAAFIPFFIFAFLMYQKYTWKKSLLRSLPFFLIGLLAGLSTIRGVNQSHVESTISKSFHTEGAIQTVYKATPVAEIANESQETTQRKAIDPSTAKEDNKTAQPSTPITKEYIISKKESLDITKLFFKKLSLSAETITFYIFQFIYPHSQYFFYEKKELSFGKQIIELFILCSVITLSMFSVFKNSSGAIKSASLWSLLFVTLWLPVSGIFYVPFMKYALYADHWGYFLLLPLAILLGKILEWLYARLAKYHHKINPIILFVIPISFFIIKTSFYSRIFNDHEYMLERNIAHNPSSIFLRRYLADYLFRRGEIERAIDILEKAQHIDSGDLALASQLAKYRNR